MYLTDETKKALEQDFGKPISEIAEMDFETEKKFVESKTKRPLIFSKVIDLRMTGRGNPLIVRKRICKMQDIDKKIEELK